MAFGGSSASDLDLNKYLTSMHKIQLERLNDLHLVKSQVSKLLSCSQKVDLIANQTQVMDYIVKEQQRATKENNIIL